jgi:hypothetical protein
LVHWTGCPVTTTNLAEPSVCREALRLAQGRAALLRVVSARALRVLDGRYSPPR